MYFGSELERLIRKFEILFMNNIANNLLEENIRNWLEFLTIYFSPPTFSTNTMKPLIKLSLELKISKRKLSISSEKSQNELLSIEPNSTIIYKTLISPLEMLIDSINSICRLDKQLFPLLSLKDKPSFYITKENARISEAILWIKEKLQNHLRFFKRKI